MEIQFFIFFFVLFRVEALSKMQNNDKVVLGKRSRQEKNSQKSTVSQENLSDENLNKIRPHQSKTIKK
jgi:hypothetical protein